MRDICLTELKQAIAEIERGTFLPWFLEEQHFEALQENSEAQAPPTNFLRELEEGSCRIYDTQAEELLIKPKKMSLELMRDKYESDDNGVPKAYAIFKDRIYVAPKPDQAYIIQLPYYQKGVIPEEETEEGHFWLDEGRAWAVWFALERVAKYHQQNPKLGMLYEAESRRGKSELYGHHVARQMANDETNMGED